MTKIDMMRRPSSAIPSRATIGQLLRYGIVGLMNTLLTLVVIYVLKSFAGVDPWTSNACGYVAGFINSFVWNKLWVFRSHKGFFRESILFGLGFLICYAIQFVTTWLLTKHTPLGAWEFKMMGLVFSGYGVATVLGMAIYTLANFIYNRIVTFSSEVKE